MQQELLKVFSKQHKMKTFKAHIVALACSSALFPAVSMAHAEPDPKDLAEKPAHVEMKSHRFERGDTIPGGDKHQANKNEYLPDVKDTDKTRQVEGLQGAKGLKGAVGPQAAAQCTDYAQFASLTGEALFNHVRSVDVSCVNQLFENDATSVAAYQSQNVVDVANRALSVATSYDSSNGNEILKLITFLRGAFFVEFYNDNLTYTDTRAVKAVIEFLVAYGTNPYFGDSSDMQADTLKEFFIAWDNTRGYQESVPSITRYLNSITPEHLASAKHGTALTKAFTTLYFARNYTDFTLNADRYGDLLNALEKVATSDYIINSTSAFQSSDAFKEFGRFYSYHQNHNLSAALKTRLNNGAVAYKDKFELYSPQWANVADYLSYYNPNNCQQFGVCNWKENLEANVLPVNYSCNSTVGIRAQQMTTPELQQSCDLMEKEEVLFHEILATGRQPVADDNNTELEVNIFNSADEYKDFAGTIFGINTDNGGIYLEGIPSEQDNQARFIAHEATWRDDVLVWNLGHEYVHYLDARFNLYGAQSHFDQSTQKVVWWTEGLAEYISKQNRNDDVINLARTQAFKLSEVMANTYDSGDDRIYGWGYLAVRFMFEEHRADVDELLVHARAGNSVNWLNYINSIGQRYDEQWNTWLTTVASTDEGIATGITPPDEIIPPVVESCGVTTSSGGNLIADRDECVSGTGLNSYYTYVNADNTPLYISTSGGSGDVNVYFNQNTWASTSNYTAKSDSAGNNELVSVIANRGWVYIGLNAEAEYQGVTLSVSETKPTDPVGTVPDPVVSPKPTVIDACATENPYSYGQLNADDAICIADGRASYYFYIPANTSEVNVTSGHGTGNVDLYGNSRTWATSTAYEIKSDNADNIESLTLNTPAEGWYYLTANGAPTSTGASLVVNIKK